MFDHEPFTIRVSVCSVESSSSSEKKNSGDGTEAPRAMLRDHLLLAVDAPLLAYDAGKEKADADISLPSSNQQVERDGRGKVE